jgi:hypothetical protein
MRKRGRGKGVGLAGVGPAGRESRKGERKEEFPFSFFKQVFQTHFQKVFKTFYHLDQNQLSQ